MAKCSEAWSLHKARERWPRASRLGRLESPGKPMSYGPDDGTATASRLLVDRPRVIAGRIRELWPTRWSLRAVKTCFRERHRRIDPVALLAEIREELGNRLDRRTGRAPRECRWKERYGLAQLDRGACGIRPRARQWSRHGEPRATHGDPSAITRNGSECRVVAIVLLNSVPTSSIRSSIQSRGVCCDRKNAAHRLIAAATAQGHESGRGP
jgi:hypothetical protein